MRINYGKNLFGSLVLALSLVLTSCSTSSQEQQQEALSQSDQGEDVENFNDEDNTIVNEENQELDQNQDFDNSEFSESAESGNDNLDVNEDFQATEDNGDLENIVEEMNQSVNQEIVEDQVDPSVSEDMMNTTLEAESTTLEATEMGNSGTMNMVQEQLSTSEDISSSATSEMTSNSGPVTASVATMDGLPEIGSKMSYIVQKGDTLAEISNKIFGDMSKWRELAAFSGLSNPSLIYPGDLIYYQLDEKSMAFAKAYENLPRSEVTIAPGDTLAKIATRVLGSGDGWRSIWRENDKINDPDELVAGETIYYISNNTYAKLDNLNKINKIKIVVAKIETPKTSELTSEIIVNKIEENEVVLNSYIDESALLALNQ